jgi:histidinol-phosphatase (PHP family)
VPGRRRFAPSRAAARRVSVHGGHSGEFCLHARDGLTDILDAYIAQGFEWVGISEHMPPPDSACRYPEECAAGLSVADLEARFARYLDSARSLQRRLAGRITIFVGAETEACPGAIDHARRLCREHRPDYLVGSVHHVAGYNFDASAGQWQAAATALGGVEALYLAYFDRQLELIEALAPAVVGHFDLVRLFDPEYPRRLTQPAIWRRIERNLQRIRSLDLILDFNVRALLKGAGEPYISRPILERARELGIAVVPGDDSHGVATVGARLDDGIALLRQLGFDTRWRRPVAERRGRPACDPPAGYLPGSG